MTWTVRKLLQCFGTKTKTAELQLDLRTFRGKRSVQLWCTMKSMFFQRSKIAKPDQTIKGLTCHFEHIVIHLKMGEKPLSGGQNEGNILWQCPQNVPVFSNGQKVSPNWSLVHMQSDCTSAEGPSCPGLQHVALVVFLVNSWSVPIISALIRMDSFCGRSPTVFCHQFSWFLFVWPGCRGDGGVWVTRAPEMITVSYTRSRSPPAPRWGERRVMWT